MGVGRSRIQGYLQLHSVLKTNLRDRIPNLTATTKNQTPEILLARLFEVHLFTNEVFKIWCLLYTLGDLNSDFKLSLEICYLVISIS